MRNYLLQDAIELAEKGDYTEVSINKTFIELVLTIYIIFRKMKL